MIFTIVVPNRYNMINATHATDKQTFQSNKEIAKHITIYSTDATTQSAPTFFGTSGQLGIFLMRWGVYPYMIFVILLTPVPFSAQNCDTKNHAKSGFLIPKNIKNALILDILTPG